MVAQPPLQARPWTPPHSGLARERALGFWGIRTLELSSWPPPACSAVLPAVEQVASAATLSQVLSVLELDGGTVPR